MRTYITDRLAPREFHVRRPTVFVRHLFAVIDWCALTLRQRDVL